MRLGTGVGMNESGESNGRPRLRKPVGDVDRAALPVGPTEAHLLAAAGVDAATLDPLLLRILRQALARNPAVFFEVVERNLANEARALSEQRSGSGLFARKRERQRAEREEAEKWSNAEAVFKIAADESELQRREEEAADEAR